MNNIKNGSKITFEKVYFFIVFLYAARATIFTSILDFRLNPIGFALLFLPALYYYFKYHLSIFKGSVALVFLILTLWMALHFFIDTKFDIFTYYIIFLQLFVGYVTLNVFREKIYLYFEKVTVALSVVAIVLWSIMQVVGVQTIASLGFMEPNSSISSASLLIFNTPRADEGGFLLGLTRNNGFAWEPGLFSCFLGLAMYFNLTRKQKIKGNINFYILAIALISTSSTTGYSLFFVLICNYFIFQRSKSSYKIIALVILVPVVIWGSQLPFMGEKIKETSSSDNYISESIQHLEYMENEGYYLTVQRFEGLYLEYLNLKEAPFLGYGSKGNSYMNTQISPYIVVSSGVITNFSQFGFILGLLITLVYIKSAIMFDRENNQKYMMLFVVYLFMSMSYSFNLVALFISIMWAGILLKKDSTIVYSQISK